MNTTPLHQLSLAGIIALCLVLPLMASALAPKNTTGPKPWLRTVWFGQALVAMGALIVIASPIHPAVGVFVAAASCAFFGLQLHRQLRQKQGRNS